MNKCKNFISYVSVPSLKNITICRIVIKLWEIKCFPIATDYMLVDNCSEGDADADSDDNDTDTDDDEGDDDGLYFRHFAVMKKEVFDSLPFLPLPTLLKKEIMDYVFPIGKNLFNWLSTDRTRRFELRKIDHRVFWTVEGTVDVSKTIRFTFHHHREDPSLMIPIMNACLGDLVEEVWNRMPKCYRDIDSIHNHKLHRKLGYHYHLVMFWICHFGGSLSRLIGILFDNDPHDIYDTESSVYVNMFNLSVQTRNELAAKYFFPKLTEEEKDGNIWRWIERLMHFIAYGEDYLLGKGNNGLLGILFFLLGQMKDSEQQIEVFQEYYRQLIPVMVRDWPWQKYILQTISLMFPLMTRESYVFVMKDMIFSAGEYGITWRLFREVWCVSPSELKMCFVRHLVESDDDREGLLRSFITAGELDTFELIVNCASEQVKKYLVFSCVQSMTFISTAINDLNTMDEFIKGTLLCESDVSACKVSLMNYVKEMKAKLLLLSPNWKRTEEFVKWCFESEEEANQFIEHMKP